MSADRSTALSAFAAWAQAHITGDEKGEAQIFIDHLFRAFGHAGSLEVGGTPEFCVRKAKEDGGPRHYGGITSRANLEKNFQENCLPVSLLDRAIPDHDAFLANAAA
jgi:hypothetical protein